MLTRRKWETNQALLSMPQLLRYGGVTGRDTIFCGSVGAKLSVDSSIILIEQR
jgi:hypothetical protein